MQKYLRPEARPADWESLDEVQQDAFSSVARTLGEAINNLSDESVSSYYGSEKLHSLVSSERASRTLFISGARGTGKTTVLVTLIRASLQGSLEGLDVEDVKDCIKKMRDHLVWLEPLDMEPLPKNSNLLGSILARIDAAIRIDGSKQMGSAFDESDRYKPRQLFEPTGDYHDSILKLQRLQTDIAIAWDGNIEAREGHLDPDTFALETMRSEQSRLLINNKFHQVLDLLSLNTIQKGGGKGVIFVLPVDDIDLNPTSCLKLLSLFRLISVPRLFTIVLGDLNLTEVVLNLKFTSDLAKVAEGAELLYQTEISKAAANISSNSLRKLVPTNQRLHLAPMNTWESLKFRPLGTSSSELTIYELLNKFALTLKRPFVEPDKVQQNRSVNNLADFLLFGGLSVLIEPQNNKEKDDADAAKAVVDKDRVDKAPYSGLDFMNATPREIADIWFGLRAFVDSIVPSKDSNTNSPVNKPPVENFYTLLANKIQNSLFAIVGYEEREIVRLSIRKTPKGEWELGRLPIKISAETESIHTIEQKGEIIRVGMTPDRQNEYEPRIRLCLAKGWRFEKERAIDKEDIKEKFGVTGEPHQRIKIPAGTAATIMLFHDLLSMCEGNDGFRSTLFIPSEMRLNWVATERHIGEYLSAELVWPCPPCKSFWEFDIFLNSWTRVLQKMSEISSDPDVTTSYSIESLFFVWVSAGTAIIDREGPVTITSPHIAVWPNLITRLENLKQTCENSKHKQEIVDWLINIGLLIMPECGLPEDCRSRLLNSVLLKEFWNSQTVLIAQRRAKKLALLLREGMVDLMRELRTKKPDGIDYATVPDESMVYRYAGVEMEEEEKERKRSYDIAAMVEQRLSDRLSKIGELSKNVSNINSEIKTLQGNIVKLQSTRKAPTQNKATTPKGMKKADTSKAKSRKK